MSKTGKKRNKFLILPGKINDLQAYILSQEQFNHEKYENQGHEVQGSILNAPVPFF